MSINELEKKPSGGNPFQRLNQQLAGIEPGLDPIIMTIGEPRHEPPSFVMEVLEENQAGFRKYPTIRGTDEFRAAVGIWLKGRFNLSDAFDPDKSILPLNGSREGLVFGSITARDYLKKTGAKPAVILPNPFYQSYGAGAHIAGAAKFCCQNQRTVSCLI